MISGPHRAGRRFRNDEPATAVGAGTWLGLVRDLATNRRDREPASSSMITRRPGRPLAPVPVEVPSFPEAAADLAATWLGHATVLIEVDGRRVLADPIFGFRASPVAFTGPARLHRPPIGVAQLPHLDAIVISHDHYDHLDRGTIIALATSSDAPFCVPLGIGRLLRTWGVPERRVIELDWHEAHEVSGLAITCTPARHFSGRGLIRNTTLWSSWTITGPRHRVFFGGDTGYTSAFEQIGARYGPFYLTALPIGAYDVAWPDIHMTPEQAAAAHRDLRGEVLLPIHWATFDLARHPYAEPIERLLAADLPAVLTPPPGRRLVLDPARTGELALNPGPSGEPVSSAPVDELRNPAPSGGLENPFWWREAS